MKMACQNLSGEPVAFGVPMAVPREIREQAFCPKMGNLFKTLHSSDADDRVFCRRCDEVRNLLGRCSSGYHSSFVYFSWSLPKLPHPLHVLGM